MMGNEPWLDGLAEDWVPQLSISPAGNSPNSSTRPGETFRVSHRDRLSTAHKSSEEPSSHTGPNSPAALRPSARSTTSTADKDSHENDDPFLPSQTIQVRATPGEKSTDAPEWKRRILQGEVAIGERTDLFAPIGLESIFRPPNDDNPTGTASLRARLNPRGSEKQASTNERKSATAASDMAASAPAPSTQKRDMSFSLQPKRQPTNLLRPETLDQLDRNSCGRLSPPIEQSELEEGNSADFSSIRITSDLYKKRPSSANAGHDSVNRDQAGAAEATLEMTSQSLPEGLSMGTPDPSSLGGFINTRRGGYSDEGSFLKRRLSPSSIPSKLHPSTMGSSQLWSSPSQSGYRASKSAAPLPTMTDNVHSTSSNYHNTDEQCDPNLGQSGSPLKLFDNHDTFTNKRLLRRMGQFEKTLDDYAEDELELPEDDDTSPTKPEATGRNSRNQNHSDGAGAEMESFKPTQSNKPQQGHPQPSNTATNTEAKAADWLKRQKLEPAEMKRRRNSPTKDSSPKRRRTLRVPDSRNELWHEPILHSSEFMSKNDFEDSHCDDVQGGGPTGESQASKPSSSGSNGLTGHGCSSGGIGFSSGRPSSRRTENGDTRAGALQQENGPRNAGSHIVHERRKGSITTQDFLDEATKIMNFIREKGRMKSDLAELAESDNPQDDCGGESSEEEFVRPPSREFSGAFRRRSRRPPNPRIVSHLKKFEEKDEQDMFMGASAMSLRLRRAPGSPEKTLRDRSTKHHGDEGQVESSPKNVRVREAFHMLRRRHSFSGDSSALFDDHHADDIHPSLSSRRSVGTLPTAYSQHSGESSGKRGIISSNMISHLIPGKVGKMVYDHAEQRWVRAEHDPRQEMSQGFGEVSEEDPFQDIPDLSVNELQELINARDFVEYNSPAKQDDGSGSSVPNRVEGGMGSSQSQADSGPQTTEGTSTVQSKSTHFTGSYPKPETRATSWATEDIVSAPKASSVAQESATSSPEEALHESQVHDRYISPVASPQRHPEKQPRAVTITFSSPVVSHVAYSAGDGEVQEESHLPATPLQPPSARPHSLPETPAEKPINRAGLERPSSGRSLGRQMLSGRPVSRIDEGNEDCDGEANVELSMVPLEDNGEQSVVSRRKNDPDKSYSFHLSPLPDFTVNQVDESMKLEVSYVAERTNPKSLRQVHGTFALAAETLVRAITDTEPFEVYWEQLRQLGLREKNLITLLKLNQFCPRLEDLDASNNRIGQLSGVPSSIRSLNVAGNCLSNITAWTHLLNLQYVDVSDNELESLDGVSGLVHLRSLKANGNRIRNVGGAFGLDGLLSLELKDNALEEVDFGEAELFRLKNLDLSGNQLSSVGSVESLLALETLDLRDNRLGQFEATSTLQQLRSLKLSRNRLCDLDISPFPHLRLLYIDRNSLSTVQGLGGCEHLEALSMREQSCASDKSYPLTVDLDLCSMPALCKLYLSSNKLSPSLLVPHSPLTNLQFMDAASCSLEHLPREFGTNFSSLKALNLNFNALTDIAGLEGATRLSRLALVGNRISRLRRLCNVLRLVGGKNGTLRKVDLRGNPLTVGFYPAPVLGSGRRQPLRIEEKKSRDVARTRRDSDGDDSEDKLGLKPIADCSDVALRAGEPTTNLERRRDQQLQLGHGDAEMNVEVDDPYTIPAADPIADQKYLVHLDEATQLRRRVVELMVGAATAGQLRVLDGLEVVEGRQEQKNGGTKGMKRVKGVRKDWVWERLVELGVLKKRELNGLDG